MKWRSWSRSAPPHKARQSVRTRMFAPAFSWLRRELRLFTAGTRPLFWIQTEVPIFRKESCIICLAETCLRGERRDIKTMLCILAGSHHILRGRLRMLGDPVLSCRRLPSRGALRGNAHAKVRGKVKGKTPARAQALARAQK